MSGALNRVRCRKIASLVAIVSLGLTQITRRSSLRARRQRACRLLWHVVVSRLDNASSSPSLWRRTDRRPVVRVVDGDTLELDRCERIRLIGIDCPEMNEPLGPEVADWVRRHG